MPFWVGDPLRGAGKNQPGGWIFNLLPYVEHESVYRLSDDGDADHITVQQMSKTSEMLKIALPVFQDARRDRLIAGEMKVAIDDAWTNPRGNHRTDGLGTDIWAKASTNCRNEISRSSTYCW